MALEQLDVGAVPNDGTGDVLREAGLTINANSTETEDRLIALEADIPLERVSIAISGPPNKPELEAAAALLASPAFDYAQDRDFYVLDTSGAVELFLVRYEANGDTAQGQPNYVFWYVSMTAAT